MIFIPAKTRGKDSFLSLLPSFFLQSENELTAEEIGDGNLNFLYRIMSKDGKSVIAKVSPPFIRCLGPEYSLSSDRLIIEAKSLAMYNRISPEYVPQYIGFDHATPFLLMEDLRDHILLRIQLIQGHVNIEVAKSIGRFMALSHCSTLIFVQKATQDEILREFDNSLMKSITLDYIFTKPFIIDDPTNRISPSLKEEVDQLRQDEELQNAVQILLNIFNQEKQALIHGDLHTGSIMVNGNDVRVIDSEFAMAGPIAFDTGLLLANYLFSYIRHTSMDTSTDIGPQIQNAMELMWDEYIQYCAKNGLTGQDIARVCELTLGFAGAELFRRVVGTAHVVDLDSIQEEAQKFCAERKAMYLGYLLIKHISSPLPNLLIEMSGRTTISIQELFNRLNQI